MKIFVSGQINDLQQVHIVQQSLRNAGHTITHDWTNNEGGKQMLCGDKAKFSNPNEASIRAQKISQA